MPRVAGGKRVYRLVVIAFPRPPTCDFVDLRCRPFAAGRDQTAPGCYIAISDSTARSAKIN
jgi:hypothetical protein